MKTLTIEHYFPKPAYLQNYHNGFARVSGVDVKPDYVGSDAGFFAWARMIVAEVNPDVVCLVEFFEAQADVNENYKPTKQMVPPSYFNASVRV